MLFYHLNLCFLNLFQLRGRVGGSQKVFKLGSSHFLATNLTSTGSSLNAEFSGIQHKCLILPIPDYIIFTNLYLDLPPVIGLQNFEVL